jgi:hypothetical protein
MDKSMDEAEKARDTEFLKEIKWRRQLMCWRQREPPGGQLEYLKASGILPRPTNAPPNLIDLASFYTGALDGWLLTDSYRVGLRDFYGVGLGDLPQGVVQLGGTPFDIRAVVQMTSSNELTSGLKTPNCLGIPVNQICHRLYFLQAADAPVEAGVKLGAYWIHYTDGQEKELPIIYGQDVLSWLDDSGDTNAPALKPVWQTNRPPGITVRLFRTTWTNPRPGTRIESLDLVAAMAKSGLFLVAITAEP